ncbi:MAG: hypothetical protein KME14_21905 [Tildeniella torsiva UHER 1998/13D]|jgi:uncharacterized DUF497 family protein|nr:hypothetical protein [Tildeniella torsiva UHER 1998/13D]
MNIAPSISGISIRLPNERWQHIIQRHADIADKKELVLQTIAAPDIVRAGNESALMAIRQLESGKFLVVVYKETQDDGFVITAFSTRKINSLNQRQQLWP